MDEDELASLREQFADMQKLRELNCACGYDQLERLFNTIRNDIDNLSVKGRVDAFGGHATFIGDYLCDFVLVERAVNDHLARGIKKENIRLLFSKTSTNVICDGKIISAIDFVTSFQGAGVRANSVINQLLSHIKYRLGIK